MTNVLTNPDGFFSELSAKDTKLMTPFAIVLVVGILAAISAAMMMDVVASSLPEETAPFASMIATISVVMGLIVIGLIAYSWKKRKDEAKGAEGVEGGDGEMEEKL